MALNLSNCGSIKVIKHTNPRGLDQAFSYTTSGSGLSGFSLNDAGNSSGDNAANTKLFSSLHPGAYSVTEAADPAGFAFASLNCTGGANITITGRTASITLAADENVVCTYVNDQQLGAIKVLKSSIKGQALAGATFSIAGQSVQSGADGTACVDHLAFGNYNVSETAAPPGYSRDDTTVHSVNVGANTTCASAPVALSFNDTPLTNIAASAHSQAVGGTQSSISCVDGNGADVGNSPRPNDPDPAFAATDLAPGTYVCTIVVDP